MSGRGGLNILNHPNATNPRRDPLVDRPGSASVGVHVEVLGEEHEAEEALEVNTQPTLGAEGGGVPFGM
ncbi:hypothetical protein [Mesorhizobium sanjuanii]|uniref:hypothetical protein n=1 Tax=Mesorhizobium sanjuanii TaxID=2037900 RepID=UPI001FE195EB|nr:hypothetical protein [Mesorhizobium sanjuanii]